jgi:hypothetical protein
MFTAEAKLKLVPGRAPRSIGAPTLIAAGDSMTLRLDGPVASSLQPTANREANVTAIARFIYDLLFRGATIEANTMSSHAGVAPALVSRSGDELVGVVIVTGSPAGDGSHMQSSTSVRQKA